MYILHLVLKTDHSLSNSLQAKALFKQQNFLARSANLLEGLYILLALISSFYLFFIFVFTMSKAISVSTGPIFTIFSPNESIFVNFLDAVQFSRFFKGRCHGNQFCFVPDLFTRSRKYLRIRWTDFHSLSTVW